MKNKALSPKKQVSRTQGQALFAAPVGVLGLGLMGQGLVTCLLANGYNVMCYDIDRSRNSVIVKHVQKSLEQLAAEGLLSREAPKDALKRLSFAVSMRELKDCRIILECIRENLDLKRKVLGELETYVSNECILASNTSSFPISLLQHGLREPGRFIGLHWGEPAQIMRYLEIIPGRQTSAATTRFANRFGVSCGKEPTLLKQDIRGFLSNRLMYAMLREAFHLVEMGIADVETIDQSFRNDIGWWALLAGPFRWMDLTGIPAYAAVMEGLLPELCNQSTIPPLMQKMLREKALGTANQKGFYKYSKATAAKWEKDWVNFTYEMRKLADRYTPTK